MTWKELRDAGYHCREKIHAAKGKVELQLVRNVGANKNNFFKYVNGNRRYRNIIGLLQDEDGHLTHRDRDKAEMLNAFFTSVCNTDGGPRGSQCPELEDHDCENDQRPVDHEILRNQLLALDPYKSMGPGGTDPRIFKNLTDVITKHLSIFEQSWESRKVTADWKLVIVPIFRKGLEGILRKFADDTKLRAAVGSLEDREALQRDLNKSEDWAITNHMKFNKGRHRILHLGWGNSGYTCRLQNKMLESSATEGDLGVLVDDKLNSSQQCPGNQEDQPCPGGHQAKHRQLDQNVHDETMKIDAAWKNKILVEVTINMPEGKVEDAS
ncbi:hypothetical protein WISP_55393 [Willisornis vidua]|uniref:Uncharacterized protein n=1 Tax=Willisornis vidua TaxID=1566151 RepID=A0ABQ9DDQ0_9PASS|nr:hypothetical protein WISP_55393 [Willisornis vidua]